MPKESGRSLIEIDGRPFKAARVTTVGNDSWNASLIDRAIAPLLRMYEDEGPDDFASRVYAACLSHPDTFLLLGGLLIPADREAIDWTPEMARQTATFLRSASDPDSNLKVRDALFGFIQQSIQAGAVAVYVIPRPAAHSDEVDDTESSAAQPAIAQSHLHPGESTAEEIFAAPY